MGAEAPLADLRWARGCRCFAICEGGEVHAYGWVSTGPEWIGEAAAEIRPGAGEAYVWNCVTLPPYRRRGLFRNLVAGITVRLTAEGVTRIWIAGIDGTAEKALQDVGYEPALKLDVRRWGPVRRLRALTGDAPLRYRRLGLARRRTH